MIIKTFHMHTYACPQTNFQSHFFRLSENQKTCKLGENPIYKFTKRCNVSISYGSRVIEIITTEKNIYSIRFIKFLTQNDLAIDIFYETRG